MSLYDQDPGGIDDLLGTTTTDTNGYFQFPTITNWDDDDIDPDPNNRRLDLYIVWETEYEDSGTSSHRVTNLDNQTYKWYSSPITNTPDGAADFSASIPANSQTRGAMWILQDLRNSWEYVYNNTITQIDSGSVIAKWQYDVNCYSLGPFFCNSIFYGGVGGPFIFISHQNINSADTVVHETGHHYMYNATGWWLWWDTSCYVHYLFGVEDVRCAWSEGWADFFPLAADDNNNDSCYDFDVGPCTGTPDVRHYNLESHSRGDNPIQFPWGDEVEGRVAGALYDLFDNTSDGYDSAAFNFDPIAGVLFQGVVEDRFDEFWNSWKTNGQNQHQAVRAFHQNTIEYDTQPGFAPLIPDINVLQDFSYPHFVDLWTYSIDSESSDGELTFQATYISNIHCGITLDDHWVNVDPDPNWLGSCDITIEVSDSIMANSDTFRVNVLPITGRSYLPTIMK